MLENFSKHEIRKLSLEKRKSYSNIYIQNKSESIMVNLFNYFNFNNFGVIHMFLPIVKNNEVDTTLIINKIIRNYENIKIIVPVIDFQNEVLIHKYYSSYLNENKYGVPEPISSKLFVKLDTIDIILVPLLVFDKIGNRVGYGKGYYDKFLSNHKLNDRSVKIGLSLEEPIELISDINNYDQKLDYCITPNKIHNFTLFDNANIINYLKKKL